MRSVSESYLLSRRSLGYSSLPECPAGRCWQRQVPTAVRLVPRVCSLHRDRHHGVHGRRHRSGQGAGAADRRQHFRRTLHPVAVPRPKCVSGLPAALSIPSRYRPQSKADIVDISKCPFHLLYHLSLSLFSARRSCGTRTQDDRSPGVHGRRQRPPRRRRLLRHRGEVLGRPSGACLWG